MTRKRKIKYKEADYSALDALITRHAADIAAMPPIAKRHVASMFADLRRWMDEGDYEWHISAYARSVVRIIESYRDGYYIGDMTPTGGFRCA